MTTSKLITSEGLGHLTVDEWSLWLEERDGWTTIYTRLSDESEHLLDIAGADTREAAIAEAVDYLDRSEAFHQIAANDYAELRAAAANVAAAEIAREEAIAARDKLIRRALWAKCPARSVAAGVGMSLPRVYQVRDGRR